MSKIDVVRKEMMQALKDRDLQRKSALSLLLSALKAKAIDKRADLTEAEENEIILKEIRQTQETLDAAPADHVELIEECKARLAALSEFAPKQMNEQEIREVIATVLSSLGIEKPTAKDRGAIMKNLMPLVKGKADSGLVSQLVGELFK